MRFVSVASREENSAKAFTEVADQIRASGVRPDLLLLFFTMHHAGEGIEDRVAAVRRTTGAKHVLGSTGEGLIGGGAEHEGIPAVVAQAAELPGTRIQPFAFPQEELESALTGMFWKDRVEAVADPVFLVLADPFSIDVERLLYEVDLSFPGAPAIGGNASGGHQPGTHVLCFGDEVRREGAIGVALSGGFRFRALVAQGCRPIGRHLVVTEAHENIIAKIGGKPALAVVQEVIEQLSEDDLARVRRGLHIGRVINESKETFKQGDFLIKNVIGIDRESGALAAGDLFRKGQTIQFHVRDADAAREDLRTLLTDFQASEGGKKVAGSMLFSCNGRGERLFGVPDHDTRLVREVLGEFPIAGFFCAGEIGPVGGKNFLHGFTSSVGLFIEA